jgi:hypothetical protein
VRTLARAPYARFETLPETLTPSASLVVGGGRFPPAGVRLSLSVGSLRVSGLGRGYDSRDKGEKSRGTAGAQIHHPHGQISSNSHANEDSHTVRIWPFRTTFWARRFLTTLGNAEGYRPHGSAHASIDKYNPRTAPAYECLGRIS